MMSPSLHADVALPLRHAAAATLAADISLSRCYDACWPAADTLDYAAPLLTPLLPRRQT